MRDLGGLALGLVFLLSLAGSAGAAADAPRSHFGKGRKQLGLSLGGGLAYSAGFVGQGDGRNADYLDLRPRFGVGLSGELAPETWARGHLALLAEGEFLFALDGGSYQGLALLLRYAFVREQRFVPFLEGGSGIGRLDFDLRDQDDGFSFTPQAGAGLLVFVAERTALEAAIRWHHISNAGTHMPNNSINDVHFALGITCFLD